MHGGGRSGVTPLFEELVEGELVFFLYMVGLLVVNVMYVMMVRVIVMDGGCLSNLQMTLTI